MTLKKISAFILITIFLLILYFYSFGIKKEFIKNAGSFNSKKSHGLSILDQFLTLQHPSRYKVIKNTLATELDKIATNSIIIISDSLFKFSPAEEQKLITWIENGGHAWIHYGQFSSLELEREQKKYSNKLRTQEIELNPRFINQKIDTINSSNFSFYSPFSFKTKHCEKTKTECYLVKKTQGKGAFIYSLGLNPLNNLLISQGHNKKLIFDILKDHDNIYLDSYHQFYTEKNWKDFIVDFKYSLPLILSLLIILFSYVFLETKTPTNNFKSKMAFSNSIHGFFKDILNSQVNTDNNSLFPHYYAYLEQKFPSEKNVINACKQKNKDTKSKSHFKDIVKTHQTLIYQKEHKKL